MMKNQENDKDETYNNFKELVNMAPAAIEKWLETDESKQSGQTVEMENR